MVGDHCQARSRPRGLWTAPPAARTIVPSPNAIHRPSWLTRTGGAAAVCTRVRSLQDSSSSTERTPSRTQASAPSRVLPATRAVGHARAFGVGVGVPVDDPERSQEGISVAPAPIRAATPAVSSNTPTARPVLRRLCAYMRWPERLIAPLTVAESSCPSRRASVRRPADLLGGLVSRVRRSLTRRPGGRRR